MKFYHNDTLVITSKNRIYEYAVIQKAGNGYIYHSCHETLNGAKRSMNGLVKAVENTIKNNMQIFSTPENSVWFRNCYEMPNPEQYKAEMDEKRKSNFDFEIVKLECK